MKELVLYGRHVIRPYRATLKPLLVRPISIPALALNFGVLIGLTGI
ncbi:MAG: hypothetical protein MK481_01205 [SAR324 cluster bacterium]|nr:hypothetical protein [SAR324 cluster bacterium]